MVNKRFFKDFERLIKAGSTATSAAQQLGIEPRSQSSKPPNPRLSESARNVRTMLNNMPEKTRIKAIKELTKNAQDYQLGILVSKRKRNGDW